MSKATGAEMDAGRVAGWVGLVLLALFGLVVVEPEIMAVLPSWVRAYKPEVEIVRRSAVGVFLAGALLGWCLARVARKAGRE